MRKSNAVAGVTRVTLYLCRMPAPGGHLPGAMTTETMAKMQGKALWYVGPCRAELHEEAVGAPKPGEGQVRALFGAISRGTERLPPARRVPGGGDDRLPRAFMGGAVPC